MDRSRHLKHTGRSPARVGSTVVFCASMTRSSGSSPLARGLPKVSGGSVTTDRIIPARAGFTRGWFEVWRVVLDHPRSRGVYVAATWRTAPMLGSSPLARGLPLLDTGEGRTGGIIPARAGFTVGGDLCRRESGDHPRSRGVYVKVFPSEAATLGSSPLARGLPLPPSCPEWTSRIIPARAGFTGRRRRSGAQYPDHPRSRGVYPSTNVMGDTPRGSSPLARGLLACFGEPPSGGRIIPARAGFTLMTSWTRPSSTDHPRSRGVYVPYRPRMSSQAGSSPLARGLR